MQGTQIFIMKYDIIFRLKMARTRRKQPDSREEKLRKKRDAEKRRYERMKETPQKKIINLHKLYPKISKFSWNYYEAGHGKGAPDGIGGVTKRTADRLVAEGKDIGSFEGPNNTS